MLSRILGGTALVLLLLLGIQTLRVSRLSGELADQKALTKSWKDAQQVTRSSLDEMIAVLRDKNAESQRRAAALDDAKAKAAANAQRNADAFRSTQQKIDSLRATRGTSDCPTPEDVREALAGL